MSVFSIKGSGDLSRAASKRILDKCRELAVAQQWETLLDISSDEAAQKHMPKLLPLRVVAAGQLGDVAVLDRIVQDCIAWPKEDPFITHIINAFIGSGKYDRAWRILRERIGDPDDFSSDDQISRICKTLLKRLLSEVRGQELELEVKPLVIKLNEKWNDLPTTRSAMSYRMVADPDWQQPATQAVIHLAPATLQEHGDKASAHLSDFMRAAKKVDAPEVFEASNVFVDSLGRVWNEAKQRRGEHGGSLPEVTRHSVPNVDVALHAIHPTKGIYHWLVDRLPQLAWLKSSGAKNIPILLSASAPSFERGTVSLAGFPSGSIVEVDGVVFCRKLYLPFHRMGGFRFWNQYRPLYETLVSQALSKASEHDLPQLDQIYISRRDARRRPMQNEARLETELQVRGFASITFSDIPLWQQIATLSKAKMIVAPHGAGLAHIVALNSGAKIVEIAPARDGSYFLRLNYARLAMLRGHDYAMWLEEQDAGTDNWRTSIPEFLAFLDNRMQEGGQ